jgi:hypothetical protein
MILTHDVYSEMNPAYCTYVLGAFVSGFITVKPEGPELLTAYLSLPLALSGELEDSFEGTNKNTGLMEWLGRSPYIQIKLTSRLNGSFNIVTEAVRLACFSGALVLDSQSRLQLGSRRLKQSARQGLGVSSRNALRRADRLGHWFAAAGSSRTIFEAMGLTV